MARVTLQTIFGELKKNSEEIQKLSGRLDTRFEFLKDQFHSLDQKFESKFQLLDRKIESLDRKFETKFQSLDQKFESKFGILNKEIVQINKKLSIIRDQTAHITERVTTLEQINKDRTQ